MNPTAEADALQAAPAPSAEVVDYFSRIREPKAKGPIGYTPAALEEIVRRLRDTGFRVVDLTVNPSDFRAYFEASRYTELYPGYYAYNIHEKALEHFVAATLLSLDPGDTYIDVASEHSPAAEIYGRLFGCKTFRQDLAYPEGMNGDRIGGDAASMPVPDGFASKMALHCSFEHFEGDADMRFARQLDRVLRKGGRACFLPLYLFTQFAVQTDAQVAVEQSVSFDEGAIIYCHDGWANRHARFYDPEHLESRFARNLNGLDLTLYQIVNAAEIDPSCYLRFAAVATRP